MAALLGSLSVERMNKMKNKHRQRVKGYTVCMQCKTGLLEFIETEDLK